MTPDQHDAWAKHGRATLAEDERDQMAHAIGHRSAKGCSVTGGRNHYATSADDPVWVGLVRRGLAAARESSILGDGEAWFSVTPEGRSAVDADPRSQLPGRRFTVMFRGVPECPIHVRAESHAKARYAAVVVIQDGWNVNGREGFEMIESCRLTT